MHAAFSGDPDWQTATVVVPLPSRFGGADNEGEVITRILEEKGLFSPPSEGLPKNLAGGAFIFLTDPDEPARPPEWRTPNCCGWDIARFMYRPASRSGRNG